MLLREETAPAFEVLPVAEFRDYLRLGSGFGIAAEDVAEDAAEAKALAGFLRAAMTKIEARTGKVLLARRYRLQLDDWRDRMRQTLPLAPVQAIETVEILDSGGGATAVPQETWRLVEDDHRPALMPVGLCLPHVPRLGSVVLRFTAGFGEGWEDIPGDLALAVLILATVYYEDRGLAANMRALPAAVSSLIEPWRTVRLSGGGRRR